jgi:hypothetical protein
MSMNQKKNYKEDFFPSGYDNNQPIYFSMVYQKIFKKKRQFSKWISQQSTNLYGMVTE